MVHLPENPMRFVDEYRNETDARKSRRHRPTVTRPWTIMEICGGQTHTLIKLRHRPDAAARRSR